MRRHRRQIEPRDDAAVDWSVRGTLLHEDRTRPGIGKNSHTRDDWDRARKSGPAGRNLTQCKRRRDSETHSRKHPEAGGHTDALDTGQHHQPRIRRLVDDRPVQQRGCRTETEQPHHERAERVEGHHRSTTPRSTHRRMHRAGNHQEQEAHRKRLMRRADREQPDTANVEFPRTEYRVKQQSRKRRPQSRQRRGPSSAGRSVPSPHFPPDRQPQNDEDDDGQAGKDFSFRMFDNVEPSPDAQVFWCLEHAQHISAEGDRLVERPPEPIRVLKVPVAIEDWNQQGRRDAP